MSCESHVATADQKDLSSDLDSHSFAEHSLEPRNWRSPKAARGDPGTDESDDSTSSSSDEALKNMAFSLALAAFQGYKV